MSWAPVIDRLVGVIDLKGGVAVHGIAGHRDRYQPVELSRFTNDGIDGDPIGLLNHYRACGVRRFYIADLDSLSGREVQVNWLERLLSHQPKSPSRRSLSGERWIMDVGLHEKRNPLQFEWLIPFQREHSETAAWVVASESAQSIDTPKVLSEKMDPASLILGIDFRHQAFVGPKGDLDKAANARESTVDQWVQSGRSAGIRSALVLDVASVGVGQGPSAAHHCCELRSQNPGWRLISGGGCRDAEDVAAYVRAGCDECLVATALQR